MIPWICHDVDYKGVIDKWGVNPEWLGGVFALADDAADNIPWFLSGIGPYVRVVGYLVEKVNQDWLS